MKILYQLYTNIMHILVNHTQNRVFSNVTDARTAHAVNVVITVVRNFLCLKWYSE